MDYTPQETTDTQSGAPVKEKVSLKDRLRKWVAERSRKKKYMDMEELPDFADTVQPAMERLTDDLIEQTVGPDGALLQAFREQISRYDPEKNPISPREARALLNGLLDLAASRRKLLNERLWISLRSGPTRRWNTWTWQRRTSASSMPCTPRSERPLSSTKWCPRKRI